MGHRGRALSIEPDSVSLTEAWLRTMDEPCATILAGQYSNPILHLQRTAAFSALPCDGGVPDKHTSPNIGGLGRLM